MDYLIDDYIINDVDNTVDFLAYGKNDTETQWVKVPMQKVINIVVDWHMNAADPERYRYHKPYIWLVEMAKVKDIEFIFNEYCKRHNFILPEIPEHRSCN